MEKEESVASRYTPARLVRATRKAGRLVKRLAYREWCYRRAKPTNILPFLTYRCSSHCRSCAMWQRHLPGQELELSEWKAFFDSLAPRRLRHVEFFGGDVMLRQEVLFPLIEQAHCLGWDIDIPINGVLLDEAAATRLAAAPIGMIAVSVDGTGQLHDQVRGVPGNFDRIRAQVGTIVRRRSRRNRPRLTCNCTVSALNIDGFEQVLPFAVEMGFDFVAFEYGGEFPPEVVAQSVIEGSAPQPYFTPQEQSLLLTREQALQLKDKLEALKRSPLARRIHLVTSNIDVLTVDELAQGVVHQKRCYICHTLITVDPFGNVLPCPFFDNYHLGNVREQPFSSIWNNTRHRRFRRLQSQGRFPMCRHCILSVERNSGAWERVAKRLWLQRGKGRR